MSNRSILWEGSLFKRKLPLNLNQEDLRLFERELTINVPNTFLLEKQEIGLSPKGVIFKGNEILGETFPDKTFFRKRIGIKAQLSIFLTNLLSPLLPCEKIDENVFWITDIWSAGYFHWLTDALPRLFAIREQIKHSTLLLPSFYRQYPYIRSSLKPFLIPSVRYIQRTTYCQVLQIPTHTAPTGNYNEGIMKQLRQLYFDYFKKVQDEPSYHRVYISRSKALRRKIVNEDECIEVFKNYGFTILNFEDYSFEEQIKITQNIQYLISNHGAGLTNILFMQSNASVLELRKQDDDHNNCYFSLASALDLKYYYQLCAAEKPDENAHQANLIVNCQMLAKNIEQMFKNDELNSL